MVRLADLTSPEVGEQRVLVLPIGSTEQHGPHLPLDTDTVIATAVAERAAAASPSATVAPAIAIGASGEHQGFPGTLSIGTRVLSDAVVEIVRTAGREFGAVVVVNGHGGNLDALTTAGAICRDEGRPFGVWHARAVDGGGHAGHVETSVMLALVPDRVRLDAAVVGVTTPIGELVDELRAEGMAGVSPSGILGDPTAASAEVGEEILGRWVGEVADMVRTWSP